VERGELVKGRPVVERFRRAEGDDDAGIHLGHGGRAAGGVVGGGDLGHEQQGEHNRLLGSGEG